MRARWQPSLATDISPIDKHIYKENCVKIFGVTSEDILVYLYWSNLEKVIVIILYKSAQKNLLFGILFVNVKGPIVANVEVGPLFMG